MSRGISILLLGAIAFTSLMSSQASGGGGDGRDGDGLRGVITAIYADRAAFDLTVRTDRGEKTIVVKTGDRTRIYVNGHRARFRDLEVDMGAGVRGRFNNRGVFRARVVSARSRDGR